VERGKPVTLASYLKRNRRLVAPTLDLIIALVSVKEAPSESPRDFSEMQSEKAGDHNDHDHDADDVEDIH